MKLILFRWTLICALFAASATCLAQSRVPVWIDTDPSVAIGGHEVDDGFALIQAFHSPELEVRGVSIVFGNAPLSTAWPIGSEIVERFGPLGLKAYRGASSSEELGQETEASKALATAVRRERLTILAIGPVTNVATVLKLHPELAKNIQRIICVAGRRPGQRFVVSSSQQQAFRDFNFELDPAGFQVLLDSGIPLVLAPWEISSKVWIRRADLEQLRKGGPQTEYLAGPALDWLEWWRKNLGTDGFNPFDTLAVAYVTSPGLLHCSEYKAIIQTAPDDISPGASIRTKPYLNVSADFASARTVTYCSSADPRFKEDLIQRLLRRSTR